jgi:hypothetical protein
VLGRRFTLPGYRVPFASTSLDELRDRVGCDVTELPMHCHVIAWDGAAEQWLVHLGARRPDPYRLPATMRYLDRSIRPRMAAQSWWFVVCLADGWREREDPNVPAPTLTATGRPVLAYARRVGDESSALLPEAHYLERFHYQRLRFEARVRPDRWVSRRARAVYCGRRHGRPVGGLPDGRGPVAREVLRDVVERERLDVDVRLDASVPRRAQRAYRYLIDVDGFVRTFDAWAWKVLSGSVVLAQESPWETLFTREFAPWEHYVPVREDFADLAERLAWCRANDAECHDIAVRARGRALEVYALAPTVERSLRELGEWVDSS